MTQTQQTVLALAIYTIWIALLYIRIFDKTLKKYVLSIGVLLAFWMVVRMLKIYNRLCNRNVVVFVLHTTIADSNILL